MNVSKLKLCCITEALLQSFSSDTVMNISATGPESTSLYCVEGECDNYVLSISFYEFWNSYCLLHSCLLNVLVHLKCSSFRIQQDSHCFIHQLVFCACMIQCSRLCTIYQHWCILDESVWGGVKNPAWALRRWHRWLWVALELVPSARPDVWHLFAGGPPAALKVIASSRAFV